MRKLVVSIIASLDGYISGPGDDVMALPMDGFFDEHNLELQRGADTVVAGTKTYLGFKGWWPAVAEDPKASPAVVADPGVADLHQEIGRRMNENRKVVVSDSLTPADTAPWADTTTIVPRSDVAWAVAELKAQPGRDILVFGSATVYNALLDAGLVDVLHVMVAPAALGGGTAAFTADRVPPLRLAATTRREGSSNVLLTYEVDNS